MAISAAHGAIYTVSVHLQGPSSDSANSALTYSAVPFENEDPSSTVDMTKLDFVANTCDIVWQNFWPAYATPAWVYRGVTVTAWGLNAGVLDATNISQIVPGTATSAVMPPGVCYDLVKNVDRPPGARRSPQGRFYMPCVREEAFNDAGELTGTQVNNLATLFTTALVVAHRQATHPVSMQLEFKLTKQATVLSREPIQALIPKQKATYLRKRGR